jgi:hypothetical protein
MSSNTDTIRELAQQEYKWGFVTDVAEDRAPKGLSEDIILSLLGIARKVAGRAQVGQRALSAHRLPE